MNKICISELILPGSLISIRLETKLAWSLNIVCNSCDEGIDIPLTPDLLKSNPFIDTFITLKYKNEYFEYIITGSISKIELCGSPFIRVQVLDIFENKNLRLFPRYDVHLPASLSIDNNTYFCAVTNISLGGISFILDKEIASTTQCEANIFLDGKNSIFSKGIILRCSPQDSFLEFSLQFTFMDEEDSNCLYSYLHSIDSSYDNLRNKYLINSYVL